jgi:hypothetical protein
LPARGLLTVSSYFFITLLSSPPHSPKNFGAELWRNGETLRNQVTTCSVCCRIYDLGKSKTTCPSSHHKYCYSPCPQPQQTLLHTTPLLSTIRLITSPLSPPPPPNLGQGPAALGHPTQVFPPLLALPCPLPCLSYRLPLHSRKSLAFPTFLVAHTTDCVFTCDDGDPPTLTGVFIPIFCPRSVTRLSFQLVSHLEAVAPLPAQPFNLHRLPRRRLRSPTSFLPPLQPYHPPRNRSLRLRLSTHGLVRVPPPTLPPLFPHLAQAD